MMGCYSLMLRPIAQPAQLYFFHNTGSVINQFKVLIDTYKVKVDFFYKL